MSSPMGMLTYLRDALATLPGVKTCKVGMEANIGPLDYPAIRIVPADLSVPATARNLPFGSLREADITIHYGLAIHEFEDGLEAVYEADFEMESAIVAALPRTGPYSFRYVKTYMDEDSIEAFKWMGVRVSAQGRI